MCSDSKDEITRHVSSANSSARRFCFSAKGAVPRTVGDFLTFNKTWADILERTSQSHSDLIRWLEHWQGRVNLMVSPVSYSTGMTQRRLMLARKGGDK
jgi:hypothetical protein